jgi:hypothetical protein
MPSTTMRQPRPTTVTTSTRCSVWQQQQQQQVPPVLAAGAARAVGVDVDVVEDTDNLIGQQITQASKMSIKFASFALNPWSLGSPPLNRQWSANRQTV